MGPRGLSRSGLPAKDSASSRVQHEVCRVISRPWKSLPEIEGKPRGDNHPARGSDGVRRRAVLGATLACVPSVRDARAQGVETGAKPGAPRSVARHARVAP